MEFNFPKKEGTGIAKLIPNVSPEATEVITKLLIYDYGKRQTAGQVLKHAYFAEFREIDKQMDFPLLNMPGVGGGQSEKGQKNVAAMRLTNRNPDQFSNNSKRYVKSHFC